VPCFSNQYAFAGHTHPAITDVNLATCSYVISSVDEVHDGRTGPRDGVGWFGSLTMTMTMTMERERARAQQPQESREKRRDAAAG